MLTEAFDAYRPSIENLVMRICGEHVAEDVTQDVFARLWTNPLGFDPSRGTIRQYLLTVARGIAIDRVRQQAAARARDERDVRRTPLPTDQPSDRLIARERGSRVAAALQRLPEQQRDAISATYFGHMTYQAAAVMLGVPEGTMKSRIRIGLKNLRSELHDLID